MLVHYQTLALDVRPDPLHEWLLDTALVAAGFEVAPNTIVQSKRRHADELMEGKHWIELDDNSSPNSVGRPTRTYWTKRGVIRLGFFIKSPAAKRFRDWAEDLILRAQAPADLSMPHTEAPHSLREKLAYGLRYFGSFTKLAHYIGCNPSTVSMALRGKPWKFSARMLQKMDTRLNYLRLVAEAPIGQAMRDMLLRSTARDRQRQLYHLKAERRVTTGHHAALDDLFALLQGTEAELLATAHPDTLHLPR